MPMHTLLQAGNLVPLLLVVGGLVLRPIYRRCPKPTFSYHGPNFFWIPLLLILVLFGVSHAMLLGAGPLSIYLLIVEGQARAITIESLVSAILAVPVSLYTLVQAARWNRSLLALPPLPTSAASPPERAAKTIRES